MEFREMERRLDDIHHQLLEARDSAQAGLQLLDTLMLDLVRENALRQEGPDGSSNTRQG